MGLGLGFFQPLHGDAHATQVGVAALRGETEMVRHPLAQVLPVEEEEKLRRWAHFHLPFGHESFVLH